MEAILKEHAKARILMYFQWIETLEII